MGQSHSRSVLITERSNSHLNPRPFCPLVTIIPTPDTVTVVRLRSLYGEKLLDGHPYVLNVIAPMAVTIVTSDFHFYNVTHR